ncbi:energy transducer TonB, partial [Tamilnaduibacter salinus]
PEPEPEKQAEPAPDMASTDKATTQAQTTTSAETAREGETQESASDVSLQAGQSDRTDEYLTRLNRHLARHYDYPRRAKRLNQEGTPEVRFRFNRDGELVSLSITAPSDYPLLDEAAKDIIRDAEPLPAVPEDMEGQTFGFTIPIRFQLQ